MKLNSEIKEILDDRNITDEKRIRRLREAICVIIFLDRDFSKGKVNDNLEEIQKKINIKETFNSEKLFFEESNLNMTEEVFTEAIFELQENFCDKRLDDVRKIGQRLYGEKIKQVRQLERNSKSSEARNKSESRPRQGKIYGDNNSRWTEDNQKNARKKKKTLILGGMILIGVGIASWLIMK